MARQAILGEFEQLLLLSILQLGPGATGSGITEHLEEQADRRVSRGALYSALDRLGAKEFLEWTLTAPSPERGGHPARVFSVTERGLAAVRLQQRALRNLTLGLDEVLGVGDA